MFGINNPEAFTAAISVLDEDALRGVRSQAQELRDGLDQLTRAIDREIELRKEDTRARQAVEVDLMGITAADFIKQLAATI